MHHSTIALSAQLVEQRDIHRLSCEMSCLCCVMLMRADLAWRLMLLPMLIVQPMEQPAEQPVEPPVEPPVEQPVGQQVVDCLT